MRTPGSSGLQLSDQTGSGPFPAIQRLALAAQDTLRLKGKGHLHSMDTICRIDESSEADPSDMISRVQLSSKQPLPADLLVSASSKIRESISVAMGS